MGSFVVTAAAESRAYLARPFVVDFSKLPQPMRILLTMREKVTRAASASVLRAAT